MDFIISLAHFCEIHGPTSILCTQITPVSCATCQPCHTPPYEAPPQSPLFPPAVGWPPGSSVTADGFAHHRSSLSSPFESPPTSPRGGHGSGHNPYFPNTPDYHVPRRYSVSLDADGPDSCGNCTFLVPGDVSSRLPDGAPGSPTKDGKGKHGSPVLRTHQAVLARGTPSPPDSDNESANSSSSYSPTQTNSTSTFEASYTSTPATSPLHSQHFPPPNTHTHNLTYLTTQQPASPAAYSLLRRSCIRTLSCENLPRGSPSGPLYFGDPMAGYTIAYIFRLPDPRARGRRRTYALIALGGRDSWRVSRAMVRVTEVFEAIAGQIVSMADKALEREESTRNQLHHAVASAPSTPPFSTSAGSSTTVASPVRATHDGGAGPECRSLASSIGSPPFAKPRSITPVSSFLSAKQVDPDGYPRVSREALRGKGLADILGKDNFFVELHAQFCMLLSGLVREFGP